MVSQDTSPRSVTHPRILVVSRRSIRKNKYVDFVGEYHLSLLLQNGAVPVIVPRVPPTSDYLSAYEPFHGLLIVEGEDIGPAFRPPLDLAASSRAAVSAAHPADATPDHEKDRIEFHLARVCLARGVPILAICRGSQVVNVAAGGDVLADIDAVVRAPVRHIDYDNYDAHRHPVRVLPRTPLRDWFAADRLHVNSYHHQAVSRLAPRFKPMAHAPDGLVEAFYDPDCYRPSEGKFVVGLQFHPERMQDPAAALSDQQPVFDYPGCPRPYEEFVIAARAFQNSCPPPKRTASFFVGALKETNGPLTSRTPAEKSPACDTAPFCDFEPRFLRYRGAERDTQSTEDLPALSMAVLKGKALSQKYTKEELDRIMRSGGTVHGSSLVRRMLQKDNACDWNRGALRRNAALVKDWSQASQWRRFRKGVEQAQLALRELRGTEDIEEATSLINKLHVLSSRCRTAFETRLE